MDLEALKEDEPLNIIDSTPFKASFILFPMIYKPISHFSSQLIGKKVISSWQDKENIFESQDQDFPSCCDPKNASYACFLKEVCMIKKATNVPKRALLASNVSSIISILVLIKYKDPWHLIILIVFGNNNIHRNLLYLSG